MKKLNYGHLVVGLLFTMLCIIIILLMNQKYSKENVDNIKSIIHNNNYNIEDYKSNRFILNQSYHKIIEEAEKRKHLAEYKERVDRLREERKAELEKKRLAKQKEEKKVVVSRGQATKYASDWMTFEATYYTPYCEGCSGITAVGLKTRESIYHNGYRIIAVDKSQIPLWSLVEVVTPHETFKAIAGDVGGDIKGNRIDILVDTKKEAFSNGRHDVKLRVIKYGEG